MTRSKPTRYLCLDCAHEFDAGPGPTVCPACGDDYVGRLSWYAVRCTSQAEAAVADRITAEGHLALFLHHLVQPKRLNKLSRKQRQQALAASAPLVRRPVLPGYVFAGLIPPVDFYGLSKTPGVAQVLANESGPAELPISEVDRLRSWGDADGVVSLPERGNSRRPLLSPQSIVRIKAGPFTGFEATVTRDDGKLVRVMATLFGRETAVDLVVDDLEVVARAA